MNDSHEKCDSVCPKCKREVTFTPVHPLKPDKDCFLGGYICACEVTLMMDYEVASQNVIARELSDWRIHEKALRNEH